MTAVSRRIDWNFVDAALVEDAPSELYGTLTIKREDTTSHRQTVLQIYGRVQDSDKILIFFFQLHMKFRGSCYGQYLVMDLSGSKMGQVNSNWSKRM